MKPLRMLKAQWERDAEAWKRDRAEDRGGYVPYRSMAMWRRRFWCALLCNLILAWLLFRLLR